MAGPASSFVRWLARAAAWIFYRIDRVGSVPPDGALLLLPNHPNALLDPAVVWATSGRDVRFLAKSTLFDGPFRPLLKGAGAIPVYRRIDQGVDTSRNTEAFAAVNAALAAGDAVCIFPEGVSHSTGHLEPLRTGAARMTLSAEAAGARVTLMAVGLNFERKTAWRSRVTIVYGKPFSAGDLLQQYNQDAAGAARVLTERIAGHMRRLLVEADPRADAALVDRVDRLYAAARGRGADAQERLDRRRVIAAGIERLRECDPERYERLLLQVRRYDARLRRFGIRDRHLDWQLSTGEAVRFALREGLLAIVLMPLAAAGIAMFYVPYELTGFFARRVAADADVAATAKLIAGAIVYAVWLVLIGLGVDALAGTRAALVTLLLVPPFAMAALFAIERESAVIDAVRAWFLLKRAHEDTRARLRRTRSELADLLDEVYEWLNAASGTRAPSGARTPS